MSRFSNFLKVYHQCKVNSKIEIHVSLYYIFQSSLISAAPSAVEGNIVYSLTFDLNSVDDCDLPSMEPNEPGIISSINASPSKISIPEMDVASRVSPSSSGIGGIDYQSITHIKMEEFESNLQENLIDTNSNASSVDYHSASDISPHLTNSDLLPDILPDSAIDSIDYFQFPMDLSMKSTPELDNDPLDLSSGFKSDYSTPISGTILHIKDERGGLKAVDIIRNDTFLSGNTLHMPQLSTKPKPQLMTKPKTQLSMKPKPNILKKQTVVKPHSIMGIPTIQDTHARLLSPAPSTLRFLSPASTKVCTTTSSSRTPSTYFTTPTVGTKICSNTGTPSRNYFTTPQSSAGFNMKLAEPEVEDPEIDVESVEEETDSGTYRYHRITNKTLQGALRDQNIQHSGKPRESYVALISQAILASPKGSLTPNDIYNFIMEHYPFYKTTTLPWRNCIRHCLCSNKCFIKVAKNESSRGYYYAVHPVCIPEFKKGGYRAGQARLRTKLKKGLC